MSLSFSVRKSELVSVRVWVRSSLPTAMMAACMVGLGSGDIYVDAIDRVVGGHGEGSRGKETEADNVVARQEVRGLAIWIDAQDASAPAVTGCGIEIAVPIEGEALGPPEATEEQLHIAIGGDALDGIETGCSGTRDVELRVWTEGQMVGGDGGFERGKDEDFTLWPDLEDGARTVTDIEVAGGVEGDTGGNAHALDEDCDLSGGRDLVDGAVMARGDVERAVRAKGHAGRVDDIAGIGAAIVVEIDLVNRDR